MSIEDDIKTIDNVMQSAKGKGLCGTWQMGVWASLKTFILAAKACDDFTEAMIAREDWERKLAQAKEAGTP